MSDLKMQTLQFNKRVYVDPSMGEKQITGKRLLSTGPGANLGIDVRDFSSGEKGLSELLSKVHKELQKQPGFEGFDGKQQFVVKSGVTFKVSTGEKDYLRNPIIDSTTGKISPAGSPAIHYTRTDIDSLINNPAISEETRAQLIALKEENAGGDLKITLSEQNVQTSDGESAKELIATVKDEKGETNQFALKKTAEGEQKWEQVSAQREYADPTEHLNAEKQVSKKKQEITHLEVSLPKAMPTVQDTAIGMPSLKGSEFFAPGRTALERTTSMPSVAVSDKEPQLQRSNSSPAALAGDASMLARSVSSASVGDDTISVSIPHIHRRGDNHAVLVGAIVGLITSAALFSSAAVGSKNNPEDTVEDLDANADQLDSVADTLEANEQNMISQAGDKAYSNAWNEQMTSDLNAETEYATEYNAWVDGGFEGPQPEDPGYFTVNTDRISGHCKVSPDINSAEQERLEQVASENRDKVEAETEKLIDDTVSALHSRADASRKEAEELEVEAHKMAVDSDTEYGFAAAGMLTAALLTGKFVMNRRHNHEAKGELENSLGQDQGLATFNNLYKGDGYTTINVKA